MTEDDVRRIIREELDRAFPERLEVRPLPIGPDYPIRYAGGGPVQPLPMPVYRYQETSAVPGTGAAFK